MKFLIALLFVSTVLAHSLKDALEELVAVAEEEVGINCYSNRQCPGFMRCHRTDSWSAGKCKHKSSSQEEELAFNRGRTATACVPECQHFDRWRPATGANSCTSKCAAAWPEVSSAKGTCVPGELAGVFAKWWAPKCAQKDKNACVAKDQCKWIDEEFEVAGEAQGQGTLEECKAPLSNYFWARYRENKEKSEYKADYKAELAALGVGSCKDVYKGDCGQRLKKCISRKNCKARNTDRYSDQYMECIEWEMSNTRAFCDKACEEEEVSVTSCRTNSDCPGPFRCTAFKQCRPRWG